MKRLTINESFKIDFKRNITAYYQEKEAQQIAGIIEYEIEGETMLGAFLGQIQHCVNTIYLNEENKLCISSMSIGGVWIPNLEFRDRAKENASIIIFENEAEIKEFIRTHRMHY